MGLDMRYEFTILERKNTSFDVEAIIYYQDKEIHKGQFIAKYKEGSVLLDLQTIKREIIHNWLKNFIKTH